MRIWLKLLMVGGMTLAILIALGMVRGVIGERERYRAEAVASVERSFAGPQALAGPVLTVPYTEWVDVQEVDRAGTTRTVRKRQSGAWTFFPTTLDVSGPLVPTVRRRGIYDVRLYDWRGDVQAVFDVVIPTDAPAGAEREILRPWLSYGIADVRGIRGAPRLLVNGRDLELREGHGAREANGLHVRLAAPSPGERLRVATRLRLDLAGSESFGIVPLGKANRIDVKSTWRHPNFQGISPYASRIGERGFEAQWRVASVATDVQRQYLAGGEVQAIPRGGLRFRDTSANDGPLDALGVVLADPVDAYTQADRATKYGVLFVVLTFVGFFMFEMVRGTPIHPIQYGLVGLALAIFFLLLVSLSEHLRFGVAYVIASLACIGLIGFYLSAVLRGVWNGVGFAAMLGLLYGALYGLLVSEDNALVLGSGLLFVILAAIMIVTRKLDWYRVSAQLATPRPS